MEERGDPNRHLGTIPPPAGAVREIVKEKGELATTI